MNRAFKQHFRNGHLDSCWLNHSSALYARGFSFAFFKFARLTAAFFLLRKEEGRPRERPSPVSVSPRLLQQLGYLLLHAVSLCQCRNAGLAQDFVL